MPSAFVRSDRVCPSCHSALEWPDLVEFWWGLCPAKLDIPEYIYDIGDAIRWRRCVDGSILPWTRFRDGSANVGDPSSADQVLVDTDPKSDFPGRCPTCGVDFAGTIVCIRGGVIIRAGLVSEDEFELLSPLSTDVDSDVPPVYGRADRACSALEEIDLVGPAVVAVLTSPSSHRLMVPPAVPPTWLSVAMRYLAGMGTDRVHVAWRGTDTVVSLTEAHERMDDRRAKGLTCLVMAGDPRTQLRAASLRQRGDGLDLALAAAGPALSGSAIFEEAGVLTETMDGMASELASGYLSLEHTLLPSDPGGFSLGPSYMEDQVEALTDPYLATQLADVSVLDAFPYQVLGPGHIEALGGVPAGTRQLRSDRWGLSIGRLEDWLPGQPSRAAIRTEGRLLLSSCLLTPTEQRAYLDWTLDSRPS